MFAGCHIHREKQQKHSESLARTMNELIKQIRKQRNPRKGASEMRDPFRIRVINGARERMIGAEKPLGSRCLRQEARSRRRKHRWHRVSKKTQSNTGRNVLWNTDHRTRPDCHGGSRQHRRRVHWFGTGSQRNRRGDNWKEVEPQMKASPDNPSKAYNRELWSSP